MRRMTIEGWMLCAWLLFIWVLSISPGRTAEEFDPIQQAHDFLELQASYDNRPYITCLRVFNPEGLINNGWQIVVTRPEFEIKTRGVMPPEPPPVMLQDIHKYIKPANVTEQEWRKYSDLRGVWM